MYTATVKSVSCSETKPEYYILNAEETNLTVTADSMPHFFFFTTQLKQVVLDTSNLAPRSNARCCHLANDPTAIVRLL